MFRLKSPLQPAAWAFAALSMLLSASPTLAESPNCSASVPALVNGSFELPANRANSVTQVGTPNAQLVWLNTAESRIEMWHQVFNGVSAYDGSQFVELNSSLPGTLYQDLASIPGSQMVFSLAHKARDRNGETIIVRAGPPGGALTELGRYAANINGPDRNGWTLHQGTYTVPAGQNTTRFAFQSDGTTTIAPGSGNFLDAIQFTLTAGACNDAITINANQTASVAVLSNDIGASLTINAVGAVAPPGAGAATLSGNAIGFDPADTFSGVVTIPYTIRDAAGDVSSAELRVTVLPVAVSDAYTVDAGGAVLLNVLANDLGAGLILRHVTSPDGSATIVGNQLRYQPPATGGITAVPYAIEDGGGRAAAAPAIATITTTPVADLSIANGALPGTPFAGEAFTFSVTLANAGPSSAARPSVSLSMPAGVSMQASPGCPASSGPTATCTAPADVAIGDSHVFNPVFVQSIAGNGYVITSTVSSTTKDGNLAANTASTTFNVNPSADIAVTSPIITPSSVVAGTPLTLSAVIANAGPSPAAGVSLSFSFNALTNVVPPAGCAPAGPTILNCTVGGLAAGASQTISFTAEVSGAPTTITLAASGSSATRDPDPANNSVLTSAGVSVQADLAASANYPGGAVAPGSPATFDITVTNNGPSTEPGSFAVVDAPAGFTFTGAPGSCTVTPDRVICAAAALISGASANFGPITGTVSRSVTSNLDFSVSVSGSAPDPNSTNDTTTLTVPIDANADLGVLIASAVATNIAAGPAGLTVSVINNGPTDTTATVEVQVPTTFVFSPPPGVTCPSILPDRLVCEVNLAAGATSTYTINANWSAAAVGAQAFSATVTGPLPDSQAGNDSSSANIPVSEQSDLAISGDLSPRPLAAGTGAFYSISVENLGPSNVIAGATVTLPLPAGLTAGAPLPGGCVDNTTDVTCTVGPLVVGGSQGFVIPVDVAPAVTGTVTTTATVSPPGGVTDPNPINDSVTIVDDEFAIADLALSTPAPAVEAVSGETGTTIFTVTNLGPSDVPNTPVLIDLPAGVGFQSASGASCIAVGANQLRCAAGPLALGLSTQFAVTLTIPASATGSLSVPASTQNSLGGAAINSDPNAANNSTSVTLTLRPPALVAGIPSLTAWGAVLLVLGIMVGGFANLRGSIRRHLGDAR